MTAWPPQQQPTPPRQRPARPRSRATRVVWGVLLALAGSVTLGYSIFVLTAVFDQLGEPEYPPDMVPDFLEILMALALFGPVGLVGIALGVVAILMLQNRL